MANLMARTMPRPLVGLESEVKRHYEYVIQAWEQRSAPEQRLNNFVTRCFDFNETVVVTRLQA